MGIQGRATVATPFPSDKCRSRGQSGRLPHQLTGISKSIVSKLCRDIDDPVDGVVGTRPLWIGIAGRLPLESTADIMGIRYLVPS